MEGFSEGFNWETIIKNRTTEQEQLFISEKQRIQAKVLHDSDDSKTDHATFTISPKLSKENTITLLKELCKRFPQRVFAEDSEGKRWVMHPNNIICGQSYGILFVHICKF